MQKNETAVQMHQNPQETKIFPQDHLPRLYQKAEHYCTEHKIIRIDARVHRYQKANKEVIFRKFAKLIKSVFTQDPVRKKSQKPQRADEKRLAQKRKRARKLQVKNNLSRYQ